MAQLKNDNGRQFSYQHNRLVHIRVFRVDRDNTTSGLRRPLIVYDLRYSFKITSNDFVLLESDDFCSIFFPGFAAPEMLEI